MLLDVGVEKSTEERVVKTLCGMCATHCGINVHLRGDVIVKVEPMKEHPVRRLCVKSTGIKDVQYSKDRLLYPLKKVNGNWKRITWDEALDFIASRLFALKEKYGPQTLTLSWGHAQFVKENMGLVRVFAEAYGTPNTCGVSNLCGFPKWIANMLTYGNDTVHELSKTKCMVSWALNSWHSQTPARHIVESFRERGTKLIVIDPRTTHEAKLADLHLAIRPGTDLALLLAMLKVIISEELYDKEFVEKWTVGFDKLAEAITEYTPEWAEKVTWIPAKDIVECARMYATTKPACIGTMSAMEQSTNSLKTLRGLAILEAITGNLDVKGGNKIVPAAPNRFQRFSVDDEDFVLPSKTFSADALPLYEEYAKDANGGFLADAILTSKPYPVRALICQGANPLRAFLNTNKMKRAFESLDFLAVMDIFMTDLAEMADIVLPAASPLEHRWAHGYYVAHIPLVSVASKVFEPSGECWADSKFWIELGKRMGYEDKFPWEDEEAFLEKEVLGVLGKSFKDLETSPQGFFYAPKVPDQPAALRTEPFDTPSGKVEIYSERLAEKGLPPLPLPYDEPIESPITKPELFKEYPLMALTGTRNHAYEHTWGRNLPSLRRSCPDPLVQIHTTDAEKYGVVHGEWIYIESPRGEVRMKADVSEDILPGIISMPHGWGGDANVNFLTNEEDKGIVLGTPTNKGIACRVKQST